MEPNSEPQGRINPTNTVPPNPAKYFANWKSTKNCFVYYDKATRTKDVEIPLPFSFIVLARCVCLKGYNEPEGCSYISNEVKDPNKDKFTVRVYNNATKKSKVFISGLYKDISKETKAVGADWTESVYIAVKNAQGELEIANLQLNGSGITHWFDFTKENDVWTSSIHVKSFSNEKKGINKYTAPIFLAGTINKETDIKAAELQRKILSYLDGYFKLNADGEETDGPNQHKQPDAPKAAVVNMPKSTPTVQEAQAMVDNTFGPSDDSEEMPF